MNKLLVLISLVFAVGIALISLGYPLFGVSFLAPSTILLLIIVIWYVRFGNRNWRYRTSDDKTKWEKYFDNNKKEPISWETQNQKRGMFYEIDFGEERKVIEIHFSDGSVNKVPLESRIWFQRSTETHKTTKFPNNENHPYLVIKTNYRRLKKAIPVQHIKMEVLKPDLVDGIPKPWRVKDVYVRIKMLFGLEYTIGKCWLDKL